MKKLISALSIVALILSSQVLVKAEDTAPDSAKVELTKEQIYTDIKQTIATIAEGLSVGAEHVYGVLVKQQVVSAIATTCLLVMFLGTGTLFFVLSNRAWKITLKNDRHANYGDGIEGGYLAIGIILGIFFLVFTIFSITDIVTGFVNPEYGAIKEILDLITN